MVKQLILSLMIMFSAAAAALASAQTWVPKGTQVTLVFDQAVNSRYVHVGDKVKMHVEDSVIVSGRNVLPAGTPVLGLISSVRKQAHFGVNARMQITMEPVKGIQLVPRTTGKESGSRPDHAAEAAGAGALVLGPIGLVGGYFIVGKPVIIKQGATIQTEVSKSVSVR